MDVTGDRLQSLSLNTFSHPIKRNETHKDDQTFLRNSIARNTIVRRCRELYQEKVKWSEMFRRQWSTCSEGIDVDSLQLSTPYPSEVSFLSVPTSLAVKQNTMKDTDSNSTGKLNSNIDVTMNNLRQEIGMLIDLDNDLFRKLLSLYDTIAELRDRQQEVEEETSDDDDIDCCPSLESLSDADNQTTTTSPSSTLSSSSSHCEPKIHRFRPLQPRDKSIVESSLHQAPTNNNDYARYCPSQKMTPQYTRRRAKSHRILYYRDNSFLSSDSGIYVQESHSDSDHEIFV
ncbi:uncharacterized protein LOC111087140 [Limulus polyphemus]|uniref:Uncharacterized protein LOC111087140 n=1 Tax=Limulus polyphemus TaxID=6850 RepID=A0ABM1SXU7_LIMPO|nr:uncharacterized protein LOC111087140 [Limulus polyphemus]